MEDRKLISRDDFDNAVVKILTEDALRGAPYAAVQYEMICYADLCKRLFNIKEDTCDAEEALRKAVSDDDSQH